MSLTLEKYASPLSLINTLGSAFFGFSSYCCMISLTLMFSMPQIKTRILDECTLLLVGCSSFSHILLIKVVSVGVNLELVNLKS